VVKIKIIPLSQGKFALVDDEDFEELSKHKWYACKNRNTYYARRGTRINGKVKLIRMHQQLLGQKSGLVIDHHDGDGLNNQRHNIKHVTQRENLQNRHRNTSSKYPGVCWNKQMEKWHASIHINGKRKYLGLYPNEYEAYLAYRNAEMSLAYSHTNNLPDCRNESTPKRATTL